MMAECVNPAHGGHDPHFVGELIGCEDRSLCGEDMELIGESVPFDPETMEVAEVDTVYLQGGRSPLRLQTYDDWPYSSISPEARVLDGLEQWAQDTVDAWNNAREANMNRREAAVDRTFENEVRFNPRKAEDWVF